MSRRDLPTKICPICERPFTWRRKWARDWEHVKYCSKRCSNQRKSKKDPNSSPETLQPEPEEL